MTSVPKPFKFLKTYYKEFVDYLLNLPVGDHKVPERLNAEEHVGFPVRAVHDLC